MSIRRKAGDWVWLRAGAGMVRESARLKVELQAEADNDPFSCGLRCGDPKCVEWSDVWTEPDPQQGNKRHALYHVSECEMFDERQSAPPF